MTIKKVKEGKKRQRTQQASDGVEEFCTSENYLVCCNYSRTNKCMGPRELFIPGLSHESYVVVVG